MLELVSPAGSPEGTIAAVQNGADAIYLGFKEFNECMDAVNFTYVELGRALEYCRMRGVKAYLAGDALIYDRELPFVAQNARQANKYGIDAIIVQDLGAMRAVRQTLPGIPIYGSPKMCIHNLEGVKMAAAMGLSRVTLAPQLSRKEIYHICKYARHQTGRFQMPIEIEVVVHGNLCMSYPGQCYMSALMLEHSDNRGLCDKPCQWNFRAAGHEMMPALSLKDTCLVRYLQDLESIGVNSVRIEGRSKRAEYTALVTSMYSKAIRRARGPSRETMHTLRRTFSKKGFTDAFYTETCDTGMLGLRDEDDRPETPLFISTRKLYLNGEFQRVPIRFIGSVTAGQPAKLAAADDKNNGAVAYGPVPEQAFHKELTYAMLQTELYKTAGTPFVCLGVKGRIEPGLTLPMSAFTEMRNRLFAEILEQRKPVTPFIEGEYVPSEYLADEIVPEVGAADKPPVIFVSVAKIDQLSKEMAKLEPKLLYVPIDEINYESLQSKLRIFLESDKTELAVTLPRVIHDFEKKDVAKMLERANAIGINQALVSNLGHIQFAKGHGMSVRGDIGLNVYNSETLLVLKKLGLISAAISFELRLIEIRDLIKPIETEIVTYGRLPLMYTENCIIKNTSGICACKSFSGIEDERGNVYPVQPEYGHRNTLLGNRKLFLADKRKAIMTPGVYAQRLSFTTENAVECVQVLKRYQGKGDYVPQSRTRGLYFKESKEVL